MRTPARQRPPRRESGRRGYGVAATLIVLAVTLVLLWAAVAAAAPQTQLSLGARATSDHFVVLAQHQKVADEGLALADRAWTLLSPHFPEPPPGPITIVVVEKPSEYEAIQPAPMTRGFATFGGTRIYLRGDSVDQEVVTHELTHILFGLNVRNGLVIPDWFNEGLAQYTSGASEATMQLIYDTGTGRLLTLQQLDRVDALQSPDRDLATIEGLAVVRFLADQYGDARVWDLVGHLRTSRTFEQALTDTFGRTDLELNDKWMAYAQQRYSFFSPLLLETLLTLLITLLTVAAVVVWLVRRSRGFSAAGGPDLTVAERVAAHHAELRLLHAAEQLDSARLGPPSAPPADAPAVTPADGSRNDREIDTPDDSA